MKSKLLIIEDNCYRSFTTRQMLEAQLRLPVTTIKCDNRHDVVSKCNHIKPNLIITRNSGSLEDLLATLEKKSVNRRTYDVYVLCMDGALEEDSCNLERLVHKLKEYALAA